MSFLLKLVINISLNARSFKQMPMFFFKNQLLYLGKYFYSPSGFSSILVNLKCFLRNIFFSYLQYLT